MQLLTVFAVTCLSRSLMILLTDDLPEGAGGGGGGGADGAQQRGGSVSHPFVTQAYRCVAAHETKDTKNRPFKVALDEKVDVLIKDPAGSFVKMNSMKLIFILVR